LDFDEIIITYFSQISFSDSFLTTLRYDMDKREENRRRSDEKVAFGL